MTVSRRKEMRIGGGKKALESAVSNMSNCSPDYSAHTRARKELATVTHLLCLISIHTER